MQDDYVKFIRFAQLKMDGVEEGIVGVITNHSYLDNPTFKGMRMSLMKTFDQIYILDLHGSTKKKEQAPGGGDDQNVFDIQQGVAVALFIKKAGIEKGVFHADLWGRRQAKYQTCAEAEIRKLPFQKINPVEPLFLFRPRDEGLAHRYQEFWSIPAIFALVGDPAPGIVTTHDQFAISFSRAEALEKVEQLLATDSESEARQLFRLCSQSQWSYDDTKKELADGSWRAKTVPIMYRPFDVRWTIWDSHVAVHRRERVMNHMLGENIALTTSRQAGVIGSSEFDAVFAIDRPVDFNFYRRGGEYVFPAYLLTPQLADAQASNAHSRENLSSDFRTFIDTHYENHYTLEEILGCIYAVLYAPTYREKYADFLRTDFARVPFPEDSADFETLSALGWDLMQKHLLRDVPDDGLGKYQGNGGSDVEGLRYAEAEQAIYINKVQKFAPVPPKVWEFHVGGYQVLSSYLKHRKGRCLTLDEINNVENVANVLAFTLGQMSRIDEAYRAAFPNRG